METEAVDYNPIRREAFAARLKAAGFAGVTTAEDETSVRYAATRSEGRE